MLIDERENDAKLNQTSSPGTIDVREVFGLFRNKWVTILLCVVTAVGATALYLSNTKPSYTSTALLEIARPPSDKQASVELDASDILRTIELKIASRPVLNGVIRTEHLAEDPDFTAPPRNLIAEAKETAVKLWYMVDHRPRIPAAPRAEVPVKSPADVEADLLKSLSSRVVVSAVRGSRLIALSAVSHSPESAQRLARGVLDEFYTQSRETRQKSTVSNRELLMAEAKRVGDELKVTEEKLEAYRTKNNAVSLQDRQNLVVDRLRDLNQQVASAKNARMAMQPEQERVKSWMDSDPEKLLSIRSIANLPEVVDQRRQITLQEAQVATLSQRYGPLHPTMLQAKSQLEELRTSLRTTLHSAAVRVVETFESARATEEALTVALLEQEKTSLDLDRIAIPYRAIERELQATAGVYQKILDNLKQADVSSGLLSADDVGGLDIRVVEQPTLPLQPTGPRAKLFLGLALVGGLFVGCGTALLSRALDNSLLTVDAAETFLGRSILTSVPRGRRRRLSNGPIVLQRPASSQAEAFRSMRTALSLRTGSDEKRCVMFTSAIPGEGKSFCSLNYAATLTQQGFRTLLIDGDLRRPSLQWLFADRNEKPGLSDCLKNPALFPTAVQPTRVENLFRLGDWEHQSGSAELLAKGGMQEIIRQGLASYDRVVIDTAPLMAVSDTLFIARNVSTICLVIGAGKTSRRLVRRSLKLLEDVTRSNTTEIILNKVTSRGGSDHYYYYNA